MPRHYRDLLERLAEHPDAATFHCPDDLPELFLQDLAVVLKHYPTLFMDAIAEADPVLAEEVVDALNRDRSILQRQQTVGFFVIASLRNYLLKIVLRDVQLEVERLREAAAIERQSERHTSEALFS
jgi:hypothetical protein